MGYHLALPESGSQRAANTWKRSSSCDTDVLLPLLTAHLNEEMDTHRIIVSDGDEATIGYKQNTEKRRDPAESTHKGFTEEMAFGLKF